MIYQERNRQLIIAPEMDIEEMKLDGIIANDSVSCSKGKIKLKDYNTVK